MKRTKLSLIVLAILLLATALAACAPAGTDTERDNYNVAIKDFDQNAECLYREYRTGVHREPDPLPPSLTKELTVNGVTYTLEYDEYNRYSDSFCYESSDGKVKAEYWKTSLSLRCVILDDVDLSALEKMNQDELARWLQNYAAQFVQEDWDSYEEEHSTDYNIVSENSVSGRGCTGFKTEFAENEELVGRDITYRKSHAGIYTTDRILFQVGFSTNTLWFSLNEHRFDNCTVVVDEKAVQKAVTDFIYANIIEGYTLVSIEWNGKGLRYEGDNLMLSYYATISYTKKDKYGKDKPGEDYYIFSVDIPDT